MTSDYDAIIVGASFAGLAVARRLRGRVLLLDRHDVGAVQTSACATPLWVPQAVGAEESVLQVHDRAVIHAPSRTVVFDISDVPYCTFDYRTFCRGLQAQSDARFLRTAAYRLLRWAQRVVVRAPRRWLGPMAELANRPAIRSRWWPRYAEFGRHRQDGHGVRDA
jgi:flavin-dependent dehydrogenase